MGAVKPVRQLYGSPTALTAKPNASRQKQIPTAKPKLFCFCCEVFGFAVTFKFCHEIFCFCREVFGFPVRYFTGTNNGFPFLDILGYLKNTHKNPKFGKVRQVPTREFPTKFPDWDWSHAQFRRRASAVPNIIVIWFDCSTAGK